MASAQVIPPIPASSGCANRRRSRHSPRSNSRRASSPRTKKKNVISPLFTQPRRSSATPASPTLIESTVDQRSSYDDASTFTHTSAAIAPASRTAAPPVSVRRNARSGVSRLRAHAVRPEKRAYRVSCVESAPPEAIAQSNAGPAAYVLRARRGALARAPRRPVPSAARHRRHGGLGPLGHLLRRDVLDVGRDRPRVAERIRDRAEAVSPELVGALHRDT